MFRCVLFRPVLFTLVCTIFFSYANAVPMLLSHQGRLLDASDAPISGTFTIIYSIHDAPVGGTQLWMEDHVGVVVTDGLFSVELGSTVPLTADIVAGGGGGGGGGSLRYLQVQISGQPAIMPRTALVSSPFSLATERVSGDFQTRPGIIVIGDTALGKSATFGEKVNQGLHAAGSALASGASRITQDCDDDDADYMMRHTHGSFANFLHMHARTDSVGLSSSYSDATVETGMDHSSTTDGSSFSMSTKDNMPNRISMNVTVPKLGSRLSLTTDLGDDGIEDNSVELTAGLTNSRLAIKTKGTGANANRVLAIQNGATPDQLTSVSSIDDDGDTVPESEISQIVTPTTCSVAIKTRGTGADKNRSIGSSTDDSSAVQVLELDDDGDGIVEGRGIISVKSASGTGAKSVSSRLTCDPNEDGNPDGDISQVVAPGTCSVAIKTKGTGADKNRTIGSSTDDSLTINYLDIDDDGDGISEARAVSAVSTLAGGGGGGAAAASYARWYTDSDDDGIPEGDISQMVTPGTCSVAIKTKGTGADKNRSIGSSTDDSSAVQVLELDDDGDGIVEGRGIISVKSASGTGAMSASSRLSCDPNEDGSPEGDISQIVTPTTCSVAIQTKGTGADKNRTIGSTVDDDGALHYLDMDDNNDGVVERSITATVTDDDTQFRLNEGSTEVALKTHKGGVIKGAININNGGALRVELDGDGNGYLSNSLGVGTTATHHIDVVGGAYCDGTNWVNASDKNSKENFQSVDGQELLDKIADLSITEWNYKADKNARHIGPTAQDFKKTFGVGADEKSISTIDPSGIALAAIKELYAQVKERDKEYNLQLQRRDEQIAKMQAELMKLREELKKD